MRRGADRHTTWGRGVLWAGLLVCPALLPAVLLQAQAPPGVGPRPGVIPNLPPQPAPPEPVALVAGGPAPDLDLLFTAQVAGWIEPCG
jgi:hypothetical protein